jgi:hypothetical protein
MAEYVLFFRDEQVNYDRLGPDDFEALFQKFVHWAERLEREGRLRGVERLEATDGRTVRKRGGALVVDGPYVEGKETVLGYFVVEAADYDEAVRIAADCPSIPMGASVEVRRVGEFPKPKRS